ncbi:MAG: hypothetical protein KAG96_03010 [Ichthyobacteriaceae bacterium]|nr:hypothetical protein [Ichthyobacteriaceae bacterium]
MYIVIIDNILEEARVYENLTVLTTDLDINSWTLTNFFSRNKGIFYSRGSLTVIKAPVIDRKFLKALHDKSSDVSGFKLNKDQRDLLELRRNKEDTTKKIEWAV